jgi:hypothetical protein
MRNAFLRKPRGRAALLQGGILWRLSVEAVDVGSVLAGPSSDALQGHSFTTHHGFNYCDDALTEEEVELIVGVYRIYTGTRLLLRCTSESQLFSPGKGEQTAESSWWSKPTAWQSSGLYTGIWTPSCEKWYQARLQGIRSNTQGVKTSAQWRNSLRFDRDARILRDRNEGNSAAFLDQCFQEQVEAATGSA